MHKKIKYILFAFLLSVICMKVEAATLATCTYKIPYKYLGKDYTFDYRIDLTDSGTLNFLDGAGYAIKVGETIDDDSSITLWHASKFESNFVNDLYGGKKLSKECPVIHSCANKDYLSLSLDENNMQSQCSGTNPTPNSGKMSNVSANVTPAEDLSHNYCQVERQLAIGDEYTPITLSFKRDKKGINTLTVCKKEDNTCSSMQYNDDGTVRSGGVVINAGGVSHHIEIEPKYVNLYFSDSCSTLKFYLDTKGNNYNPKNMFITLDKPNKGNNGAYTPGEEWTDDGSNLSTKPPTGDKDKYPTKPKQCTSCGNGTLTDIPVQLPTFIRNLIFLLQLLIPLALIGTGIYDFIRAVVASEEKLMQESKKRFTRRIIAGVLIFFVIAIVKLIFGLIPENVNTLGCVPCFTSDASSCGETYTCNY